MINMFKMLGYTCKQLTNNSTFDYVIKPPEDNTYETYRCGFKLLKIDKGYKLYNSKTKELINANMYSNVAYRRIFNIFVGG